MKAVLTKKAEQSFIKFPTTIKKKVIKQINFLETNLYHPSLNTKKMGNSDIYEARIDFHYRFTFIIEKDTIHILSVGMHDAGLGKK